MPEIVLPRVDGRAPARTRCRRGVHRYWQRALTALESESAERVREHLQDAVREALRDSELDWRTHTRGASKIAATQLLVEGRAAPEEVAANVWLLLEACFDLLAAIEASRGGDAEPS